MQKGERDFLDSYDAFSVGLKAKSEGLTANHPIIMIRTQVVALVPGVEILNHRKLTLALFSGRHFNGP
jgi:hypothetical protein